MERDGSSQSVPCKKEIKTNKLFSKQHDKTIYHFGTSI